MAKKKMKPRRPTANLARTISTFPVELVHQIFDNLTIYNLLLLLSPNYPSLDERVCSYLAYRQLIDQHNDFLALRRYFEFYSELHTLLSLQKCPSTSPLALGLSTDRVPLLSALSQYMHQDLFNTLRTSIPFIPLLEPFFQQKVNTATYYTTLSGLQGYWHAIEDAQRQLSNAKAAQLRRVADILETYPDLVYQASDARKIPVAKLGHVTRRFRIEAAKTLRTNVLRKNKYSSKGLPSTWLFWPNFVPIVPLDKAMELFLKGMQIYPPSPTELASASSLPQVNVEMKDRMRSLSLYSGKEGKPGFSNLPTISASTSSVATQPSHRYPKPILQDICTAIEGFSYVYMPPAVRGICGTINVARARYTHSTPLLEPCFTGGFSLLSALQDSIDKSTLSRLKAVNGTPHDEREIEWLEAFLKCCRYLEQLGVDN